MAKEKCPICKGCGEIESPHLKNKALRQKKDVANILHKEGYSMREIMRLMNFKSPHSVDRLIEK